MLNNHLIAMVYKIVFGMKAQITPKMLDINPMNKIIRANLFRFFSLSIAKYKIT